MDQMTRLNKCFDKVMVSHKHFDATDTLHYLWNEVLVSDWEILSDEKLESYCEQAYQEHEVLGKN